MRVRLTSGMTTGRDMLTCSPVKLMKAIKHNRLKYLEMVLRVNSN